MMTHAPLSRRRPIDAARPGGACPPEREAGLSALSAQTLRSKSIIWVGSLEPENKELRKEYDLKEKYVSSGLQMVMFYARRGHTEGGGAERPRVQRREQRAVGVCGGRGHAKLRRVGARVADRCGGVGGAGRLRGAQHHGAAAQSQHARRSARAAGRAARHCRTALVQPVVVRQAHHGDRVLLRRARQQR